MRDVARPLAVAAPAAFTLTWLLLGAAHAGYSQRAETISALAAFGAAGWPVMVAALLLLGAGQVACASVVHRALRSRLVAGVLTTAAAGTLLAGLARTDCGDASAAWCQEAGAHPASAALHQVGAGTSFVALHVATLAVAALVRRTDRVLAAGSLGVFAVAFPHFAWFVLGGPGPWHGWAEKVFVTALVLWTGWLAHRSRPAGAPAPGVSDGT